MRSRSSKGFGFVWGARCGGSETPGSYERFGRATSTNSGSLRDELLVAIALLDRRALQARRL
jgi:hypothetical protein